MYGGDHSNLNKEMILSAAETNTEITIHLVSGEFYTGVCHRTDDPRTFVIVSNDRKPVIVPFWTVKRVQSVHS